MVTAKAHRFEQILRCWEDFWLIGSGSVKLFCKPSYFAGLPRHWHEFRDYLKTLHHDSSEFFDNERFVIREKTIQTNTVLSQIHILIAAWVRKSRRVFTLSHDLQMLLNATSLEGVTFDQVKLPFETFAIALPTPLIDKYGNKYDFIVVSNQFLNKSDSSRTLIISAVNESYSTYNPLTEDEKRLLRKTVLQGNRSKYKGLSDRLTDRLKRIGRGTTDVHFHYDSEKNTPVTELAHNAYFGRMSREYGWRDSANVEVEKDRLMVVNVADAAIRTAVGLCLYLRTLPNQSPHQGPWQRPEPMASVVRPISADAGVCEVGCQFTLSGEERQAFADPQDQPTRSFGEKCCHFRRGSWRRPIGLGMDPTAEKTEWFRPTVVRPDKRKPGELPKGAENIILNWVKNVS